MNNGTVTVGPGFLSLLTLTFIVLKLTDFIAWSWLWVLAPLWIPMGLSLIVLGIGSIVYLAVAGRGKW